MSALLSPAPRRPGTPLDRSDLVELVADIARERDSWSSLVRHGAARRWWTRLVRNAEVDVWLITWPAQEATDLHDHGASVAALTVVEGELEQVLASRSGQLRRDSLRPGTVLTVEPTAVHDVRNPTRSAAVSIHAYSPPLEQMTFYDSHPGGLSSVRTVRGNEPELEHPW